MVSLPALPLTVTVSTGRRRAAPPIALEIDVDRLATSVPVRSLTTMLSAPPRAWKSMCSTSLRSMVMLAMSR